VQWLLDPSAAVKVPGKSGISQPRSRVGPEPCRIYIGPWRHRSCGEMGNGPDQVTFPVQESKLHSSSRKQPVRAALFREVRARASSCALWLLVQHQTPEIQQRLLPVSLNTGALRPDAKTVAGAGSRRRPRWLGYPAKRVVPAAHP